MRSAFADAAEGIKRAFGGGSQEPKDPPKKQAKAPRAAPITPLLLRKGWQEGEYGRNAVTFAVEFSNLPLSVYLPRPCTKPRPAMLFAADEPC
jgi:hypothetical protein